MHLIDRAHAALLQRTNSSSQRLEDVMDKELLIAKLNEDLAGELSAIIQYITYAAKATGPYRPQLSAFFLQEVADEQMHAQFLANKIVALGGEPTTEPRPVPAAATNRAMMEAVLAAELQAGKDYTQRAQEADEYGDKGLVVALEDMVRDEMGHSEETERMLRDWPL
jgi:bacterioferritin